MKVKVKKWGNSLAVRIPNAYAAETGIAENAEVNVSLSEGGLRIDPIVDDVPTLEELLAGITPDNIHPETDWGPPVGKEV